MCLVKKESVLGKTCRNVAGMDRSFVNQADEQQIINERILQQRIIMRQL